MRLTQNITDAYQEQKWKYDNYWELSLKIWKYNEIQKQLKAWWEILQTVKAWGNKELYAKFEKEYKELYETVKGSFESEKSFSKEERDKIRQELADIVIMADRENIKADKTTWSYVGDFLRGNNGDEEREKIQKISKKSLNEQWNDNEILQWLAISGSMHSQSKKEWSFWVVRDSLSIITDSDKKDIRVFQEKLIEKMLWKWHNWFRDDGYIFAFQKNGLWNYITTAKNVETAIKGANFQDIGAKAIKNYLLLLDSKWKLNKETLVEYFWTNKANEVITFMENNKLTDEFKWSTIIEKLTKIALELKNTAVNLIQKAKDIANGIINSKNPKEFEEKIKSISQLSEEEKTEVIKTLEAELANANSELRKMFLAALNTSEKGKKLPEEKKQAEVTKLIENIKINLKPTTLDKAYVVIWKFNATYGAKVDVKKAVDGAIDVKQKENALEWAKKEKEREKAKKNKDEETVKVLEKGLEEIALSSASVLLTKKVHNKLTKPQVEDLSKQKWASFTSIVEDIRKQDKSFDADFRVLEKYEKAYYKKYPEEKPKTETISDKKQTNDTAEETQTKENSFSYANGTTISYAEVSGGYGIKTTHWVIEMNYEELQTVKKSEKALENMIHFKDTLDELNLWGLWKYRESIFQGLANKYTLAFNTKDDYLNKNELKIFLTSVLKSIGSPANNVSNFEDLKSEIKAINYGWILSWQKDVNKSWDSLIESIFIQKFDPKRTWIFELNAFQESISNLFGKSV